MWEEGGRVSSRVVVNDFEVSPCADGEFSIKLVQM